MAKSKKRKQHARARSAVTGRFARMAEALADAAHYVIERVWGRR
jgi:hypothetical protein